MDNIDNMDNVNSDHPIEITMNMDEIIEHIEKEHANKAAHNIKSFTYGGVDGVITTFAIMAAAVGADLDPKIVIIMGFSNLIADALSMGFGDYLSSNAERNYINSEKEKETYEYKVHRDHEMKELAELYVYNGMEIADAIQLVGILSSKEKYTKIFINHMMTLELDLPEADTQKSVFIKALFTFISFTIFGSIPLIVFLIMYLSEYDNKNNIFIITCVVSSITLFLVGAFGAKITKQNILKNGFLTMINGMLATSAAYFIGWWIESIL